MKVSLVVATGAHQGKVISITGSQFFIGRDAQCHLRPASQAISKRHCGLLIRDGKVYIRDYGSTNGTTVNDELVKDDEVVVENGATLKLGPLDFTIAIEKLAPDPDGTPLPTTSSETAAALAAVKAASSAPRTPSRDSTPNPARIAKPGSKETPALNTAKVPAPVQKADAATHFPDSITDDDHDKIAAMLLGMDDDSARIPDGSTVIDSPVVDAQGKPIAPEAAKADDKAKKATSREEMSSAATEALRRMMRRPK